MGTLSRVVVVVAVCFIGGWALVLISGHGGNSTGGSELVWQIGGIMVYASVLIMLLSALAAMAFLLHAGFERLRRRG